MHQEFFCIRFFVINATATTAKIIAKMTATHKVLLEVEPVDEFSLMSEVKLMFT